MDFQDSAGVAECKVKDIGQGLRNKTVTAGNHRAEGWAQQAASQDSGIPRIDSKKARFHIEEAPRPDPAVVPVPVVRSYKKECQEKNLPVGSMPLHFCLGIQPYC